MASTLCPLQQVARVFQGSDAALQPEMELTVSFA